MPREMFSPGIVRGTSKQGRWYSLPVAVLTHVSLIGGLVVVPLVATGALPTPESVLAFAGLPPEPTPPPPPAAAAAPPPPIAETPPDTNVAPITAPDSLTRESVPTLSPLVGIRPPADAGATGSSAVLAAPPSPAPVLPQTPPRVGGAIREPKKVHDVTPVYPAIARAARTEGTVILEATIGKDGSVRDVKILRGHPMLDEAALAAVRQWRYTTPMLNGEPIDVLMTVTVRFALR